MFTKSIIRLPGFLHKIVVVFTVLVVFSLTSQGVASNFPLEITNIKQAGEGSPAIPATNRIFRAYPGIEYNIRAAVIGGLYPFKFKLANAPEDMTIDSSTGEIKWSNPQSDSGTITLSVTDSENTIVTTSWSITVSTKGFYFVDISYTGTEIGNRSHPFSSLSSFLNASINDQTGIVYFRSGEYPLIPRNGLNGEKNEMNMGSSPHAWIGYPNETITFTGNTSSSQIYFRSMAPVYIDNLHFNNFSNYTLMLGGGYHYQTIRRCKFSNLSATSSVNNNYGFIYTTSASGVPGNYSVIQDNEFSCFTGTSAIGSLYDMKKLLIADNYIHDDGGYGLSNIDNGISAKYHCDHLTVRHNRIIMNNGYTFGRSSMNGGMVATNGVDTSFNLFINFTGGMTQNFNGNSWNTADSLKNFFFYRNTIIGFLSFEMLDGSNCLAYSQGPFNVYNNVIINSNTSSPGNFFTHDFITFGASNSSSNTSPWNCIIDTGNLKGLPRDNIVDPYGNLTPSFRSYKGIKGWQT